MNNLRILLYVVVLSLAACHPEGTNVKQGLDKAAQLMGQDPDTVRGEKRSVSICGRSENE